MKYSEQTVHGSRIKLQEFATIEEFNQYLNDSKPNKHFEGRALYSKDAGWSAENFSKTRTYEQAETLFKQGWKTFAEKLAKRVPVQTTQHEVRKTKPTYSVVGGQASVPRYLQGIPTNMIDRKQVQNNQKIVIINRDITFSASTSPETIEEEGIKALQLIQALENKGYRVKLNAFFLSQNDNEVLGARICLKKPEERLSLIKVAFPIAHPGMLRRIMFKWIENHPRMESGGYYYGYGSPVGHKLKDIVPKTEFIIPNFIRNIDKLIEDMGL